MNFLSYVILQNLSHVSIKAIHDTKRSTISVNNIPNDIAHWGKIISILVISHQIVNNFMRRFLNIFLIVKKDNVFYKSVMNMYIPR